MTGVSVYLLNESPVQSVKNAKKEAVRRVFVEHEEKKPDASIFTIDYSWFFAEIAKGIQENLRLPEFVNKMTADFSTTTAVQKIVSQVQDYLPSTRSGAWDVEFLR